MNADEAIKAGQIAEEESDYIGAAAAFSSLLQHSDAHVVAQARFHLGRVVWKQGRLDEALDHCERARTIAIRVGDTDLRGAIENAVGVLHVARGEYTQARAAYAVALELTRDVSTRAKITLNLGVIANIQGAYEVAQKRYAQSLMMFREARDHRGEALALHNVGMLHADRAEWDEADEAFRGALALFEAQHNRQMIANVLLNRSEVSYGRGRTHEGLVQCDLALTMYAELGDEIGRGETLRWKGHGLRVLRRYPDAEQALTESVRIAERTHTRLLHAEALRELGRMQQARGDTHAADTLRSALEVFRKLGAERDVKELESELSNVR